MNKINQNISLPFSFDSIDEISKKIGEVCESFRIESKTIVRYKLSAEESMLKWLDINKNPDAMINFEVGRKLFRPFFKISANTDALNPYDKSETNELFGTASNNILANIGLIPEYSYSNEKNCLTFSIKKKSANSVLTLLSIIVFSVLIGIIGKMFIPTESITKISDYLITPIENSFFRILSTIAGPMVFLSVVWGVYGIGDVYTFGKIGKKMMFEFLKSNFLFCALGALFYPLLGPSFSGIFTPENKLSELLNIVLDIFPSDLFSPFINGNTLQIILLAFILGFSLIFLGQRTASIARAVEQINNIIQLLMSYISKLVPYFVFIVLVNIIWSDNLSVFKTIWKFALIFLMAMFILYSFLLIYVSITCKQNPIYLVKSILPSYLIALSTASSSATFESNLSIAKNKLGIKKDFASFGVPFGTVVFKPSVAVYYLLLSFYFANVYNTKVSLSWVLTAVVITTVSAIATPPIPGGSSATYTILFIQLGIPNEAIIPALAIDMVFDFILTSSDVSILLLQLLHISKNTGMNNLEGKKQI